MNLCKEMYNIDFHIQKSKFVFTSMEGGPVAQVSKSSLIF